MPFNNGIVRLWDLSTGDFVRTLGSEDANIASFCTAWSPSGEVLASAGTRGITLWDAKKGKIVRQIKTNDSYLSIDWHPGTASCCRRESDWALNLRR